MLSPLLHCLSATSSLLQLSLPPMFRTIHVRVFPFTVSTSNIDFSCSMQTPILSSCCLYPECHVISNQVIHYTLLTTSNVADCFRHCIALTRLNRQFNLFSSLIHTCGHRCTRFSLTVHHKNRFQLMQRKVVCKRRLTVVCGSSIQSIQ